MFRDSWTDQDQRAVDHLAKKFGVDLNDPHVAGETATFASIELAASRIGKAVTRHVTQDLALQQAELLSQPQPCPDCGELCQVEVRERKLATGEVPIELHEAACHCSACRRDFFPSARAVGAARPRL